jgi:hypothetical protein
MLKWKVLGRVTVVVIAVLFVVAVAGCQGGDACRKSIEEDGGTTGPGSTGGGGGGGTGGGGTGGGSVNPPLGGTSDGSGGQTGVNGSTVNANGSTCSLIVPSSPPNPAPFLIIFSGVEGRAQMTQNMVQLRQMISGLSSFIIAVLDGPSTDESDGANVLDYVRSNYNIDNDKTCLLSESAGTASGLKLGFSLRQSYFAAYWANDVTCSYTPQKNASELGFAPHGNAGPGGNFADANAIVDGMRSAGYRLPADAPYSGAGAGSHGDQNQFMKALEFFPGKSRK